MVNIRGTMFDLSSSILKLLSPLFDGAGSWQLIANQLKLQSSQMFSENIAQSFMGVCNGMFNSVQSVNISLTIYI